MPKLASFGRDGVPLAGWNGVIPRGIRAGYVLPALRDRREHAPGLYRVT